MFLPTDSLIECVPNFSEGCNKSIIQAIQHAILSVEGVQLLHIDSNRSANRTVFTFVGLPLSVCEAAFRAIEVAANNIDMQTHKGTHPRIGATDVCPLIPIANISIEETDYFAQKLAERVGKALLIPVYCYEFSSKHEYRKRLEQIREGQYESLAQKQSSEGWEPDYGPKQWNAKSGATVIGARQFLIAFNVNLATKSIDIAKHIAGDIRQSGRTYISPSGETSRCPGLLTQVKAIGWYNADFDMVQVSTNITDFNITPLYKVLETIKQRALFYKTSVIGCELVGMIPKKALLVTGIFYIGDYVPLTEKSLLKRAVKALKLSSIKPFDVTKNILENQILGLNRSLL
jgi:glutamate formiminotransferase/formiminotetrahydrofolate cyclodeaminase